ncbi:MAG: outer membrane beta-barrel family protein, partial [Bacteroidales bacterium]|nr:outer membrane beta-barrel family protein [Bacteroidales bacterium]
SLGAELMVNLDITKWLLFNASTNLYNYRMEGNIESEDVVRESTNWDGRGNLTLKFKYDIRIQITGIYRGPTVTAQGEREGYFVTNAALRKDFLNKKLSTTLSVRDIFQGTRREMVSSGASFYSYEYFQRKSPIVSLNITYLINNYKKKRNGNGNGSDSEGGMEMEF